MPVFPGPVCRHLHFPKLNNICHLSDHLTNLSMSSCKLCLSPIKQASIDRGFLLLSTGMFCNPNKLVPCNMPFSRAFRCINLPRGFCLQQIAPKPNHNVPGIQLTIQCMKLNVTIDIIYSSHLRVVYTAGLCPNALAFANASANAAFAFALALDSFAADAFALAFAFDSSAFAFALAFDSNAFD